MYYLMAEVEEKDFLGNHTKFSFVLNSEDESFLVNVIPRLIENANFSYTNHYSYSWYETINEDMEIVTRYIPVPWDCPTRLSQIEDGGCKLKRLFVVGENYR